MSQCDADAEDGVEHPFRFVGGREGLRDVLFEMGLLVGWDDSSRIMRGSFQSEQSSGNKYSPAFVHVARLQDDTVFVGQGSRELFRYLMTHPDFSPLYRY